MGYGETQKGFRAWDHKSRCRYSRNGRQCVSKCSIRCAGSKGRCGTWYLVTLPSNDMQAIQNRWVYKLKMDGEGKVSRLKARLVAKGFTQQAGIDYQETFSQVVKLYSLRAILAVAAEKDLCMLQLDVKTAFLNGDLKEDLFILQPTGFLVPGREKDVCKLNKSLYGLEQASKAWNIKFYEFLSGFGFVRSAANSCVYIKTERESLTIMAIWLYDWLICGSDVGQHQSDVDYLSEKFEITHQQVDCFVGIKITRNRAKRTLHLSQGNYILRMLEKFSLTEC